MVRLPSLQATGVHKANCVHEDAERAEQYESALAARSAS